MEVCSFCTCLTLVLSPTNDYPPIPTQVVMYHCVICLSLLLYPTLSGSFGNWFASITLMLDCVCCLIMEKFSVGCPADLSLSSKLMVTVMMLMLMLMMTWAHESSVTVKTNNLDHHHCFPECLDVCLLDRLPLQLQHQLLYVCVCECVVIVSCVSLHHDDANDMLL